MPARTRRYVSSLVTTMTLVAMGGCRAPEPSSPPSPRTTTLLTTPGGRALALGVVPVAVGNDRPTLLRAGLTPLVAPAATAVDAARQLVTRLAPAWNVTAMPVLESRGDVILAGPGSREPATHIVRFAQLIDGMPIDRGELRVMVRASGELVMIAGALFDVTQVVRVRPDVATAAAAIDRAIAHAYGSPRGVVVTRARAERAWHVDGDHLVEAWVVEAFAGTGGTDGDAWRTVVGADGRILAHASLVANDATDYRVYADATARPLDGPIADFTPHPTGVPDHSFPAYVASRVVHVDGLNHPVGGAPDPWLASGATTSSGNNVDAYPDLVAPDGLAGDARASTSAPNAFDYPYDLAQGPLASTTQQNAAVVSLFYAINYLHDFWYDAGFVEAAGNAQASNLGRAGVEGDPLLAEAQDSANAGTRNNANMSTPGDGMSPRMQVYLWSGHDDVALTVAGRTPAASGASFEPADYDLTGTVRAAEDAVGTLTDGCEPFATVLTGAIALVDRGGCTFKSKVLRAQQAGAIGVLVANNTGTSPPSLGGDSTITDPITIPVMGVAMAEGAAIRADLGNGVVTAHLFRHRGVETDGSLDNSVVAHEFGHYLHHRLSACNTQLCGAMSEGWGDFSSLMLTVRDGDDLDGAFPFAQYVTQGISSDPAYYGIRRAPYSVTPAINALSFRHMAEGSTLPVGPYDVSGANNEVHNAGEVWTAMLWEGYVALQKARGAATFEQTRATMARYVVAGMLMAPVDATPTETRDAILLATAALSPADAATLAAAYAVRGFGSCAVSPRRDSVTFTGIVESTAISGFAELGDVALAQDAGACDDDDVLDSGETAHVKTTIANHGFLELTSVHATLGSNTPGLTVANPTIDIASLAPGQAMDVVFDVAYDGPKGTMVAGELALGLSATNGCGDLVRTILVRLDVDEVPASSATETFDAMSSSWETGQPFAWQHVRETALDGRWHGDDVGFGYDAQLVSPPIAVGVGDLVVSFMHRYVFEYSDLTAFDGGVIEYTVDGGATWIDVSTLVATPYSQTINSASSTIDGRMAFGSQNPAYPDFEPVTLEFGASLANQTIQLRFRLVTDAGVSARGWDLDDLVVTGAQNTPFSAQVADPGVCGVGPGVDAGVDAEPMPGADAGCCSTSDLSTGELGLVIGVVVILVRRRRIAAVTASWQGPNL